MFDGWEAQAPVVGRIAFAMLLGGAIGLEREMKDRPAGFRTHMLVAGTAALLLGLSRMILEDAHYAGTGLQIDPLRLVEAVVAGISFIGAGTIFASRGGRGVEGITTAASLLMVAAIGITGGFGYHVLALAITLLALAQHEGDERVRIDPFRLGEAVIAGVAFIGAGTMIAHRGRVVAGITTAASLLMVAVIGVAVGFGHGWLALLATLLTFAVLSVLAWLEGRVAKRTDDG